MKAVIDRAAVKRPQRVLPIIRQLSYAASPMLARAGLSPNQISVLGLIAGLSSAWLFATADGVGVIAAGLAWSVCYLMDYCDGEVARLTQRTSRFGQYLDDTVDLVVHASLFVAWGYRAAGQFDDRLWLWLGGIAAIGAAANSVVGMVRSWRHDRKRVGEALVPGSVACPETPREQWLYVFRVLFRADFWILVLVLSLFDATWVLLPVLAPGAHAFWIIGLLKGAGLVS